MLLKKKISEKILLFLLMSAFIMFSFIINPQIKPQAAEDVTISDLQKQIKEKEASKSSNANKKKQLENEIAALRNQQAIALNDKKIYDDLIAAIESEIECTESLIEDYNKLTELAELEIKRAEEEYEKSYGMFLVMLRLSYEEGDVNYLSMLMGSESFTDFLSRIDILSNMIEYNKNVILNVQKSKEYYEDMKTSQEIVLKQQNDYIKDLSENIKEVEGWRKSADEAINEAARKIEENKAAQAEFEQQEKLAQAEIARLQKEMQALQESQKKYVGGTFLWPLDTANNEVTSGFGNRKSPITGRPEHHNGIDIRAPKNANIYSVNDGTVILMTYSTGYGNYIVVDHGGNIATMYAHATSFNKNLKVGSTVKRGDVIAYVGSTGWSTGNHLHFAYLKNGEYANPLLNGLNKP